MILVPFHVNSGKFKLFFHKWKKMPEAKRERIRKELRRKLSLPEPNPFNTTNTGRALD